MVKYSGRDRREIVFIREELADDSQEEREGLRAKVEVSLLPK